MLCIILIALWCGVRMTHAVLCDVGFERETQHCRAVRCGVVWCHVEVEVGRCVHVSCGRRDARCVVGRGARDLCDVSLLVSCANSERRIEGSTNRSDVHASASWFTAIASALVHVSRLCGSSLAMSGRFPVHGPGPW